LFQAFAFFENDKTSTGPILTLRAHAATVTVVVKPVNDPPNANGLNGQPDQAMTDEDVAVDIDVLANDTDPDGDTLTVTNTTNGSNGTTSINPNGCLF